MKFLILQTDLILMPEPASIGRVLSPQEALAATEQYAHLFEILQPPENLLNFKPRDGVPGGGTLMVGDLVCNEQQTPNLEVHPFAEWVMQSPLLNKNTGKAYALIANVDQKFFKRKVEQKDWAGRVKEYMEYFKTLDLGTIFAIELPPGVIIKICKNAPHYFVSKLEEGQDFPYLVVFEPNLPIVAEDMKSATAYFSLPQPLLI
jgi:hypothetical protein